MAETDGKDERPRLWRRKDKAAPKPTSKSNPSLKTLGKAFGLPAGVTIPGPTVPWREDLPATEDQPTTQDGPPAPDTPTEPTKRPES
jgi:hypothetical protein